MSKEVGPDLDLRATLRGAGFRVTPKRLAVLNILKTTRQPLTVKQVEARLVKRGRPANQATVYRILGDFRARGLAQAVRLSDAGVSYERADRAHHHHVVCEGCGVVSDVACNLPHLETKAKRDSAFAKITSHSLEFSGLCKACAD